MIFVPDLSVFVSALPPYDLGALALAHPGHHGSGSLRLVILAPDLGTRVLGRLAFVLAPICPPLSPGGFGSRP